jgi:hypothetical protein
MIEIQAPLIVIDTTLVPGIGWRSRARTLPTVPKIVITWTSSGIFSVSTNETFTIDEEFTIA